MSSQRACGFCNTTHDLACGNIKHVLKLVRLCYAIIFTLNVAINKAYWSGSGQLFWLISLFCFIVNNETLLEGNGGAEPIPATQTARKQKGVIRIFLDQVHVRIVEPIIDYMWLKTGAKYLVNRKDTTMCVVFGVVYCIIACSWIITGVRKCEDLSDSELSYHCLQFVNYNHGKLAISGKEGCLMNKERIIVYTIIHSWIYEYYYQLIINHWYN